MVSYGTISTRLNTISQGCSNQACSGIHCCFGGKKSAIEIDSSIWREEIGKMVASVASPRSIPYRLDDGRNLELPVVIISLYCALGLFNGSSRRRNY